MPFGPRLQRRRLAERSAWWDGLAPYLFVLPVVILMALFIYWPLLYSAYLSTYDWNFVSPTRAFVGLRNFVDLMRDAEFRRAVENTGLYLSIMVPLLAVLPLGISLLLWPVRRSRAQTVYRAVLFAPTVVSFAVAAVLWLWILNPIGGVLNRLLLAAGGRGMNWLSDPNLALWSVVLVSFWKLFGFNLLLYLAALESVPKEYVEAAAIDGATGWQCFAHVRLPLIAPTTFLVFVTTLIFVNDELFAAISVLTEGGPFDRTANVVFFLYERGFRFFEIGTASAVALLIFLAVAAATWLQFRFAEGRVQYG